MKDHLKICVYAICKNESKFIDRWVDSLKDEADCVVVLDTGSTDDSVEKLQSYAPFVTVKQYDYFKELGYFRFDKARNDSLKLVPFDADICAVFDLDQVPRKGWADIVRKKFQEGFKEVRGYIIDHHPDTGVELNRWNSRNVHPNSSHWFWTKIIHEGIEFYKKDSDSMENSVVFCEDFVIDHFPDEKKDRTLYKKLLEYATKEYPKDPYYGIYLGIELSRRYSKEDAANAFRRCLKECDFKDDKDIQYQCYINLGVITNDHEESLDCLLKAKALGYKTRRLYKALADTYENLNRYDDAINTLYEAIDTVQNYSGDWKDDKMYFGGYMEDRLSLIYYYHKNDYLKAIECCSQALAKSGNDPRIINNLKFYYDKYLESLVKKGTE